MVTPLAELGPLQPDLGGCAASEALRPELRADQSAVKAPRAQISHTPQRQVTWSQPLEDRRTVTCRRDGT